MRSSASKKHFRVLSIDGGGVRGLIPALILERISNITGKQIPELFDFIIGTSIGGILASGYSAPRSFTNQSLSSVKFNASEVVGLIRNNADHIFPQNRKLDPYANLFNAKYPRKPLDTFLADNFQIGDVVIDMSDTLVPVTLVSENALTTQPQLWFSCGEEYSKYAIKDAAGATSAAPTFFPPKYTLAFPEDVNNSKIKPTLVKIGDKYYHKSLDGGLFANDPTLLLLYLWKKIISNKTLPGCEIRHNVNSSQEQTLNVTVSKGHNPLITLSPDTEVTIISVGTGYFGKPKEKSFAELIYAPYVISSLLFTLSFVAVVVNCAHCLT